MDRQTPNAGWNAGDALRKVLESEPWFGLALIYLLNSEQWESLRLGTVFGEIRQSLLGLAGSVQYQGSGCHSNVEDAASDTLFCLTTRDFLSGYDVEKGPPKPYLIGVAWRYLHAQRQTNLRRVRQEESSVDEAAAKDHAEAAVSCERNDTLSFVLTMIESLPAKQRDAIRRRFPAAGPVNRSSPFSIETDYVARSRGLERIRQELRKRGLMD